MCTLSSCPWPAALVSSNLPMRMKRKTMSSGWRSKVRCGGCCPPSTTAFQLGADSQSAGKAWPAVWGTWDFSQVRPWGEGVQLKEGCEEGLQCGLHPGSCGTHHLVWGLASSQGRGILIECSLALSSQHEEDLPWLPNLGACPPSPLRPRSPFLNAAPVLDSLSQRYEPAG